MPHKAGINAGIVMNLFNDNEEEFSPAKNIRQKWVVVAETATRIMAEFAVNGLNSYDVPAVLDARPGVLGTSGLIMRSLRSGRVEKFKIMVPVEFEEEASELVKQFLGDNNSDLEENDIEEN